MDQNTIRHLNQINRDFYQTSAASFDETRRTPWPGWLHLLPYLQAPTSVLDVGCGNGRLGVFLAKHCQPLVYHGVDNNQPLLDRAREALAEMEHVTLEERDIVENPPDSGAYDLVTLFGVIHHIPGSARRQALLSQLAQHVKPGGILAFACWRFWENERFRQRIIPWPETIKVEPNDFLLDWRLGETAMRYCHYVDDAEHRLLVAATGLTEVETFRADGSDNQSNKYSILRREPT